MPTATASPLEVKRLKDHLAKVTGEAKRIADTAAEEKPGHFVWTTEKQAEVKRLVAEGVQIKDQIRQLEGLAGLDAFLEGKDGQSLAASDAARRHSSFGEVKTLSEQFLESDAYSEIKASGYMNLAPRFELSRGFADIAAANARAEAVAEAKDIFSAMGGDITLPNFGRADNRGWTERTRRPGRVRDLFPSERTNAAVIYGVRQTGFTNRAAVVPERTAPNGGPATGGPTDVYGLKPKSDMSFEAFSQPLSTIAHFTLIHRNTLADEPRLRGIIDRDLVDGVKMTEDEQLLRGNGQGDNVRGLLETEGTQSYLGRRTQKRSAQIRRAMTRGILSYHVPTGLVLNPLDWEELELETDGNGVYTIATNIAIGGEKRIWRMNVVDSPAMHEGTFLLGGFGTAARVIDREEVNIRVSEHNRDYFERNTLTILCEERVGLLVEVPEAIIIGTFDGANDNGTPVTPVTPVTP